MTMTIAMTGATGFVGSQLVRELIADGYNVRHIGRHNISDSISSAQWIEADLQSDFEITDKLKGVDCVVHLAARAHVMHETAENPEALYRKMNTEATKRLAEQSLKAGVKHFVFLSSVKAIGEGTNGHPWTVSTPPQPLDIYGLTKLEAERELIQLCNNTLMSYSIIRSPLVYGPGVKANFLSLIKVIDKGIPLPFGLTKNKRSMVARSNLTSLLRECAANPRARNQIFFASDAQPLSTKQLVTEIANALGKSAKLLPVPIWMLSLLGKLTGKQAQIQRLTGDLEVDISPLKSQLGWQPPLTTSEGLRETAAWYRTLKVKSRANQRQISNR